MKTIQDIEDSGREKENESEGVDEPASREHS